MSPPRPPVAASGPTGQLAAAARLRADVQSFLDEAEAVTGREVAARRAAALVVPYDPHPLAGPTAGAGFASVEVPERCLLVTRGGLGRRADGLAATVGGGRPTALGAVAADAELVSALVRDSDGTIVEGPDAAADEALDVLLPFVQVRNPSARIVTVRLASDDWDGARRVAAALAAAAGARDDVLVVAASNLSRDAEDDRRKDRDAAVLEHLLALDGAAVLETVRAGGLVLPGAAAMACACEYARLRGTGEGELVAYSHSGIVTGNADRVTGYAAVLLGAE